MDKFKTIGVGGLPHTLNDFRQFLGRLDAPSEGIYQAFNNILGGFGTDFIVQGCVVSGGTGAFSITEGWILLSSELIKVDAQGPFDEAVDGTFTKVTTFDSRGTKTFLNGSINETYEKNRGVVSGLAGSLAFDGDRIEEILGLTVWILTTLDVSDYTADTGTWIPTLSFLRSRVMGKTMNVSLEVAASATSGGPSNKIKVKIPQSKTASSAMTSLGFITVGSSTVPMIFRISPGDNTITIQPVDGADIASDISVLVSGSLTFEID